MVFYIIFFYYLLPILICVLYGLLFLTKAYKKPLFLALACFLLYPSFKILESSYSEILKPSLEKFLQPTLKVYLPKGFKKDRFKVYIRYIKYNELNIDERHSIKLDSNDNTFIIKEDKSRLVTSDLKMEFYINNKKVKNYSNFSYEFANGKAEIKIKDYSQYGL